MRTVEETRVRWKTTLESKDDIGSLRAAVKENTSENPCFLGLRSLCWKIFLLFQTIDTSNWSKTLADSRSAYSSLKEHYTKNLNGQDDLSADDPLSDSETSLWNTLRQDGELRAEIYQDVERCMPENAYFREPTAQNMLLEILFVYCKLNRDIGYRQGMHEVLAPVLWVVHCDAIDLKDQEENIGDDLIALCLEAKFIEHDAFTLFGNIMQTVKTFYEMGNSNEPVTTGFTTHSPIVERSKRIHENYLYHADPELAEHLTAIEILPQIFLIRWIRLIFGREFPFEDALALWDILFAEDPALELVDFISVSMLLRIRWQLLEADYTAALTLLLRYPAPQTPHGPPSFVSDALYLRDNLLRDGGDHIISKYSHKSPETTVTRKLPRKVRRARTADQKAAQDAAAPNLSPSRFLQEQGGIEGILQEAARGVYSRGEKWGVTKALRSAVQGLQSGNASPQRLMEGKSQWLPDNVKMFRDVPPPSLLAKIQHLEERNRSLSKMLADSMNELWSQQKDVKPEDGKDKGADALSLAIAKVQLVQVYLENSSMPLPADLLDTVDKRPESGHPKSKPTRLPAEERPPPLVAVDGPIDEKALPSRTKAKAARSPTKRANATSTPPQPKTPPNASHNLRPPISQSPYSWMLGEEEKPKSDFVAPSPFSSSANKRQREKTGSLFGDEKKGDGGEDEDVFTVGRRKR